MEPVQQHGRALCCNLWRTPQIELYHVKSSRGSADRRPNTDLISGPCAQIAAKVSAVEDTHRLVNLPPADGAVAHGAGALGAGAAVAARQERHAGHALEADNARALLLEKSLRERVLEHLREGGRE